MKRRLKILKEDLDQWHDLQYDHLNHDYIFSKKSYEKILLHTFNNIIINRQLLWNFGRSTKDLFNELKDLEKVSNNQLNFVKTKLRTSKAIIWKFIRSIFKIKYHQAWINCFNHRNEKENLTKIKSAICFVHSGDDHYWPHFMQDASHIIIHQTNFLKQNPDINILFFQPYDHIEKFLRTFCKLKNKINYIYNENIFVETLYFPTYIPMTRFFERIVPSRYLLAVQNSIQTELKILNKQYLIYQTRKNVNRRKVINENEIIEYLKYYSKKNNLIFINFVHSNYTFKERFNLYFNSKIIIAPHGAASYHLFACKNKTVFIEFAVEGASGLFAPALVDYHILLAEKNNSKNGYHKNYRIDLKKIKNILEKKQNIDLYEEH